MDKFHTRVHISGSPVKISYDTRCMFMGSCFADNIGKIMQELKFPVMLNPFGTLFNPASVADNILSLIREKEFAHGDMTHHHGLWFSFSHYTGFSHTNADTCLEKINDSVKAGSSWLSGCRYLLLTFGSAWAYIENKSGRLVANCHKLPASSFTKIFLEPDEIIERYDRLLAALNEFNPNLSIIFTLSPVRHWADGAENNQFSKSALHYSIHKILQKHRNTYYFPAYEIFMDELRDYRFYAADMIHPSEQGIQYVWERFCDAWVDEPSQEIMSGVSAVQKAAGHRPLHADTADYQLFCQNTLKKIEHLKRKCDILDFTNEIARLKL
jgi:hypothetical protein